MAQAKGLPPTQTTIAMLMGQSPRLPTTNDRALLVLLCTVWLSMGGYRKGCWQCLSA